MKWINGPRISRRDRRVAQTDVWSHIINFFIEDFSTSFEYFTVFSHDAATLAFFATITSSRIPRHFFEYLPQEIIGFWKLYKKGILSSITVFENHSKIVSLTTWRAWDIFGVVFKHCGAESHFISPLPWFPSDPGFHLESWEPRMKERHGGHIGIS